MARFRERTTAGDSKKLGAESLAFLVLSRGSGFIRPDNQSDHSLMPGSLTLLHQRGRNHVASIDRSSTKAARKQHDFFRSARIAKVPRNNRRHAGYVSSRQAPLFMARKGARATSIPFHYATKWRLDLARLWPQQRDRYDLYTPCRISRNRLISK